MKKMLFSFLLLTSMGLYANEQKTLNCLYEAGGYDDETIVGNVVNNQVLSIEYKSYQGAVGTFKKLADNLFLHTSKDLIINELITFSSDLKSATLVVTYKENGDVLTTQHFICK